MLECLTRDHQVDAVGLHAAPLVGVVDGDVHVEATLDIEAALTPLGIIEELRVRKLLALHHLAAEV